MRAGNLLLLGAVMLSAISAHAVVRPGWERPIAKAKLTEKDATGHELGQGLSKVLIMNQQDGAPYATSFTFIEEQQVYCITAPCPPMKSTKSFRVSSKTGAGCGSTKYTASRPLFAMDPTPVRGFPSMPHVIPSEILTVVDHSTRICDDYKPYRWEVTIQSSMGGATRKLVGNPEPVYTIQ